MYWSHPFSPYSTILVEYLLSFVQTLFFFDKTTVMVYIGNKSVVIKAIKTDVYMVVVRMVVPEDRMISLINSVNRGSRKRGGLKHPSIRRVGGD